MTGWMEEKNIVIRNSLWFIIEDIDDIVSLLRDWNVFLFKFCILEYVLDLEKIIIYAVMIKI